jgi:hypothetical protein
MVKRLLAGGLVIPTAMCSAFSADGNTCKRGGSQPPIGAPGAMPQMASKWLDAVRSS